LFADTLFYNLNYLDVQEIFEENIYIKSLLLWESLACNIITANIYGTSCISVFASVLDESEFNIYLHS